MYTAGFVTPACARESYWRLDHSSSPTVGPSARVSRGPRALNPSNYLTLLVNTCFRAYRGTGLVSTHVGKLPGRILVSQRESTAGKRGIHVCNPDYCILN